MAKTDSKFKQFTEKHETLWQFIKFTLLSSVAGLSETITYLLLNNAVLVSLNDQFFDWWIFHYNGGDAGGLGTMLAFLISSIVGNGVSFVMNRKATFNANNNIVLSIILYIILIVTLICLQTYFGPIVTNLINAYLGMPKISGFVSKALMMFATFLIVFPMNKFVIMRNTDK